jgi:hypothetical protein
MKQTTKEEVIKEAYGEYYEIAKQFVDENGWIDRFKQSYYLNIGNWGLVDPPIIKNILGFNDSAGIQIYNDKWRPSILRGIENNNGWTKIESEEDLPKEDVMYKLGFFKSSDKFYQDSNLCNLKTALCALRESHYTHYRQISEFKPPIF